MLSKERHQTATGPNPQTVSAEFWHPYPVPAGKEHNVIQRPPQEKPYPDKLLEPNKLWLRPRVLARFRSQHPSEFRPWIARSQHGVSRFRVSLIESSSSNAGDVLSEGEYRCVALAGFMAELATNDSGSGIIFDDPVSSLDHLHRKAIAQRLAEEGRTRQVIVFTHDLPFLFMLRSACTHVDDPAMRTDVALRHIQKKNRTPGHCRNEAPDRAQDAFTRLKTMHKHLANCRVQYENDPDSTMWLVTARGLIDSLRQTWETAIEDAVSPVLKTFSSKVDTKGFAKLSAITEADATTMRQHYGVCSELLHKASDALNPVAPSPDDVEQEFDALQTWLDALAERQKNIKVP